MILMHQANPNMHLHPTYHGSLPTNRSAILLFQACRLNILPELTRALLPSEIPDLIKHGAVFVFEQGISGIGLDGWRDGISWSKPYFSHGFQFQDEATPSSRSNSPPLTRQMFTADSPSTSETFHLVAFFSRSLLSSLSAVEDDPNISRLIIPPHFFRPTGFGVGHPLNDTEAGSDVRTAPRTIPPPPAPLGPSNSWTSTGSGSSVDELSGTAREESAGGSVSMSVGEGASGSGKRKRGRIATTHLDFQAPTEPRQYLSDSKTSKKDLPAFAKRFIRDVSRPEKGITSEEGAEEYIADSIEKKRRQNTISDVPAVFLL
ncbi:hypothetical protein BT69DRAFT_807853 [Atractiella rhizophila]|nr:hypothetical protein BT69DRAFT_807853 [Atractiella rhizophila]